jgi:hypothetical protein
VDLQRLKRDTETGRAIGSEFWHGGGRHRRAALRLAQPPSPASRFLACGCSISVIERVKVAEVPVAGRKLWKVLVPAAVILVAAAIAGAFYSAHAPAAHHSPRKTPSFSPISPTARATRCSTTRSRGTQRLSQPVAVSECAFR